MSQDLQAWSYWTLKRDEWPEGAAMQWAPAHTALISLLGFSWFTLHWGLVADISSCFPGLFSINELFLCRKVAWKHFFSNKTAFSNHKHVIWWFTRDEPNSVFIPFLSRASSDLLPHSRFLFMGMDSRNLTCLEDCHDYTHRPSFDFSDQIPASFSPLEILRTETSCSPNPAKC